MTGIALPVEVVLIREWVLAEAEAEASESALDGDDSVAGSA